MSILWLAPSALVGRSPPPPTTNRCSVSTSNNNPPACTALAPAITPPPTLHCERVPSAPPPRPLPPSPPIGLLPAAVVMLVALEQLPPVGNALWRGARVPRPLAPSRPYSGVAALGGRTNLGHRCARAARGRPLQAAGTDCRPAHLQAQQPPQPPRTTTHARTHRRHRHTHTHRTHT